MASNSFIAFTEGHLMVGTVPRNGLRVAETSRRPSNRTKIIVTLAVLSVLSTLATIGTYALFTASTSTADNTFASGTLTLSNDHSASTLLVINNKMIPGDTITGYLNVSNTGTEDVTGYQLAGALGSGAVTNNLTDSTKPGSLKLTVDRCSVAWASGACSGTLTPVVAAGSNVIGSYSLISTGNAFCTNSASQTAALRTSRGVTCDSTIDNVNAGDHLKVVVSFPSTADNTYQGLSTAIHFTLSGGQANGVNF
jgi:spore coat-associated protein N